MTIKMILILFFVMNGLCKAYAQDMPNLLDIDLDNAHSMVEITGSIPVRGNSDYELKIVEFGSRGHEKDHEAIVLLAPDGDRAVLEVGYIYKKSGVGIQFDCEWKNATKNSNDHLVGLTNSKSTHKGHYLSPYKAWLVKIDQSPPRFVEVKASLVQCYGGAVD